MDAISAFISRKRGRSSESGESEDELLKCLKCIEVGPRRTASDTLLSSGTATAGPFDRSSLPQAPEPAPACPCATRPASPANTTQEAQPSVTRSGSQASRWSDAAATAGLDERFVPAELQIAKRARHAHEQAQQLRDFSRVQLAALVRDLEAQEQRLREELREARRSYLRRASDLLAPARRTVGAVRGTREEAPPPGLTLTCVPAAAVAAVRNNDSMTQAAQQQPSLSFSFPRLEQPSSGAAAAANVVTTASSSPGAAALMQAAANTPNLARRQSGDGPAVLMGPPLCAPPVRRGSGGTASGSLSPPHTAPAAEHCRSRPQQPQARRQSGSPPEPPPAAVDTSPLTRDGVLSSVMEMLRSKAAATAAAAIPAPEPPTSNGQPAPPRSQPAGTGPHTARAPSAQRSPAAPPPSPPPPSQDWHSQPRAQQQRGGSAARPPPVPMSLLSQQAPLQQQQQQRMSAPSAFHQQRPPTAQPPQPQLGPSPRRAPAIQLVRGL